ncbi:hypothetical protein ABZW96_05250 [Nocardia sp. NPDC004168]|uniref:hypothetical protein n=1 Tax=Nocardia sp. NPDC004168 TaxID=3154452 RepID=UPI0033B0D3A2
MRDWSGAEPGFEALPPVSGADSRSGAAVSASVPDAGRELDVPGPDGAGAPPTFPAGLFAGPGRAVSLVLGGFDAAGAEGVGVLPSFPGVFAGPDGAVPLVLGGFDAAGAEGVGVLPSFPGVFAGPEGAVPLAPGGFDAAGPLGAAAPPSFPAGVFAGPEGAVPLAPGAFDAVGPEGGGVFRLAATCPAGGFAADCPAGDGAEEAGGFGLPVPPADAAPAAFAALEGPAAGVLSALVPLVALDPAGVPAARGLAAAGRLVAFAWLPGVFGPPDAPDCVETCGAGPAGAEPLALEAGGFVAGEFVPLAGPLAGFVPALAVFASFPGTGPPPGACFGWPPGAGLPVPAPAFDLAAEASEAAAAAPPDGVAPGRCALAMRSVGAADEAEPLLPEAGIRSVAASGRASAPAASAGPALSRAVLFSSFGSDTHTPR